MQMQSEIILARGHANVRSTHRNTLEFTREEHLTPRGDCIVAVAADKAMPQLSEEFKAGLRAEDARVEITIECGGISDTITAYGHPNLILNHPTDLVIRKSDHICPRTLAIRADKAACDLAPALIERLSGGGAVTIKLAIH
jgi:uncharacterized protein